MKTTLIKVPADFRNALDGDKKAKANFEKMPPSHKREYIEAIVETKKPETRQRRIIQAIAMIKAYR